MFFNLSQSKKIIRLSTLYYFENINCTFIKFIDLTKIKIQKEKLSQ